MKRHNRLKKHTLGLAAALLMTAGMSQIALAGDSVYVNTSSLRYRTSAQIKDNNIAGNLSYGQKLERVGTSGQWTMILLNGKKYYVSSAYVTSKNRHLQVLSRQPARQQRERRHPAARRSHFLLIINTQIIQRSTAELRPCTARLLPTRKTKWSASMPDMEQTVAEASRPSVIRMEVRK